MVSGSPKYSSVSYNEQMQQAREHERLERQRRQRQLTEENRRRAEAAELSERASSSAGALAAIDTELAYVQRGVQFAPQAATSVDEIALRLEAAHVLHRQGKFTEAGAEVAHLRQQLATTREAVETEAERLALRVATVQALSTGLRARGYEVGELLAEGDGTVALRAQLAGVAGIDLAVVDSGSGDELVMQRHDAASPSTGAAACPSLAALHAELRSVLAVSGTELGDLWWDETAEAAEESASHSPERGRRA